VTARAEVRAVDERGDRARRAPASQTSAAGGESIAPLPLEAREPAGAWCLRMKDLCEATGLNRQAIHFYIREGLLPAGHKTGRNSATYGEHHLERLRVIQRLQGERFLPLKAIKAMLDGGGEDFTETQRGWLRELKGHVATTLARGADAAEPVPVGPLLDAHGLAQEELEQLETLGVVPVARGASGEPVVSAEDAWVVELMGELRALGFTEERGFGVADVALYERFVSQLFDAETELLKDRLTNLEPREAAQMTERVLPLVHRFIVRYHEAKIRRFFAALE